MIPEHRGSGSAPRIAPHPLLKSYYADESGRKRHVTGMRAAPVPRFGRSTGAVSSGAPAAAGRACATGQPPHASCHEPSAIQP
jgi:hypothetical protein